MISAEIVRRLIFSIVFGVNCPFKSYLFYTEKQRQTFGSIMSELSAKRKREKVRVMWSEKQKKVLFSSK